MTPKPNAERATPAIDEPPRTADERDTLVGVTMPELLRDDFKALLGAPSPSLLAAHLPKTAHGDERSGEPPEDCAEAFECDTEPSIDVRLVREAVLAAGR